MGMAFEGVCILLNWPIARSRKYVIVESVQRDKYDWLVMMTEKISIQADATGKSKIRKLTEEHIYVTEEPIGNYLHIFYQKLQISQKSLLSKLQKGPMITWSKMNQLNYFKFSLKISPIKYRLKGGFRCPYREIGQYKKTFYWE